MSGSVAAEAYPPSAAMDAERGYRSCHSANEPMNTGRRVSTAAVAHSPGSAVNTRGDSIASASGSPPPNVSNRIPPSVSSATELADAPATTLPCRTVTFATASSVTASESPALSAYSRLVRAASVR